MITDYPEEAIVKDRTPITAKHAVMVAVEHKITFYIDGVKYGFRCSDDTLDSIQVDEGALIPYVEKFDTEGWAPTFVH